MDALTQRAKPDLAGEPDVTVVMSPRERFSGTLRTIEALYADRAVPFAFVCIDGGSPRSVARRLAEESRRHGFRLIRTEHYLTPNEARNLAIPEVKTKYAVFIDNDLEFLPGWLGVLRQCAEETGAEIVTGIICQGRPFHSTVHFAGGNASITIEGGQRIFREAHRCSNRQLSDIRDELVRGATELAEFHCMLIRREVFDRFGLLDENLKSIYEHVDLCLSVRMGGGSVMFEPDAVVTYVMELRLSDLAYFFFRWNDDWSLASERHFHRKWNTASNDDVTNGFVRPHRRQAWSSLRRFCQCFIGWRRSMFLHDAVAGAFIRLARWRRDRALARTS